LNARQIAWAAVSAGRRVCPFRIEQGAYASRLPCRHLSNVSQSADSVASDLSLGADPSADEAALQSAAASLQSDTQAAEGNLIPVCLPDAHPAESTGLADFNNSAIDCENAISEISDGDYAVADGDIQAADAAMQSGSAEIGKATDDLKRYDPS
jgi:hypothetical protein